MPHPNPVEFADRIARRRVIGLTAATAAFLAVQVVARPVFRGDYATTSLRSYLWAINAGALLLLLLPIGGYVWGRQVRALVNDEVSRQNSHRATTGAFWLAMTIGLAIYILPAVREISAREAVYLVVTPTTAFALLAFAWLEARALRDG